MEILSAFGMQDALCEQGAWRDFGDARLLIASAFSRKYQSARGVIDRAIRIREQDKKPLTETEIADAEAALYAETILLGWENVTEGGQPLEPTVENRTRLLRQAPPFFVAIKQLAREFAPYHLDADEGALGNSARSSLGGPSGDRETNDGSADSQQAA